MLNVIIVFVYFRGPLVLNQLSIDVRVTSLLPNSIRRTKNVEHFTLVVYHATYCNFRLQVASWAKSSSLSPKWTLYDFSASSSASAS